MENLVSLGARITTCAGTRVLWTYRKREQLVTATSADPHASHRSLSQIITFSLLVLTKIAVLSRSAHKSPITVADYHSNCSIACLNENCSTPSQKILILVTTRCCREFQHYFSAPALSCVGLAWRPGQSVFRGTYHGLPCACGRCAA